MNEKKIIIACISLILIIVLMSCSITYVNAAELFEEDFIEKEIFYVERIEKFEDKNINNYTIEEIEILIKEQQEIQKHASTLAAAARELGWNEDSDPIEFAKAEWANAKLAIDEYNNKYNELIEEAEQLKWNTKKKQYPAATEIWLYMKNLGWNDYVCAGIMGNMMTECGGQTLNLDYDLYYQGYYGICQWSKGYSEVRGANLKKQCDFLKGSIKPEFDTYGYKYKQDFNFNSFLSMTNEKEAAKAFAKCYERCASGSYSKRQENATKAYNYFVNN